MRIQANKHGWFQTFHLHKGFSSVLWGRECIHHMPGHVCCVQGHFVLNVYKTGAVKWRENTVNSSDNFVFQIKTNLNKYVKRCFLRLYMSKEHVGLSIGWIKYFWREIKKFFLHGDVRALRGWRSRIITWIQHAFLNRSLKTPKTKKLIL